MHGNIERKWQFAKNQRHQASAALPNVATAVKTLNPVVRVCKKAKNKHTSKVVGAYLPPNRLKNEGRSYGGTNNKWLVRSPQVPVSKSKLRDPTIHRPRPCRDPLSTPH